jgi:ATP-dependent RNA helicase RhlE
VSHVFIHDMPTEEETYVHRIGRSGRAGATGISVALCDPDERRMLRSIEKLIGMSIPVEEVEGFDFSAALDSAESDSSERGPRQRRPSAPRGSQQSGRGQSAGDGQERRQSAGGREATRNEGYSVHRRFEKPARSESGRGQERRGNASPGKSSSGNTSGRRPEASSGGRRSESAESNSGRRPATRTPTSQARPQMTARPTSEPRTARPRPPQNDDYFGDGLFVEGSTESSGSEQRPAGRRRKRPARTNT